MSSNALPAHLGEVGNSHNAQHQLGRYDFEWTPAFDEDCEALPVAADPIVVTCSGYDAEAEPVIAVASNGDISSIECPAIHAEVELPSGVHQIRCTRGTVGAPYWQQYRLHPAGATYGVNCVAGDTVDLGIQGGRWQAVCPSEGALALYRYRLLGGVASQSYACVGGSLVPGAAPLGPFADAIDWNLAGSAIRGLVMCPASGSLSVVFLGEGTAQTSSQATVPVACTAGQPLDLTRSVLTS